jgi:CheY-like chemotaxis protein
MKMNECSSALRAPEKPADARRLCLWLADDHEPILSLLVEVLGRSGRIDCTRLFDSAEDLLRALAIDTPPDAILTDVHMGGMTGVESITPIKRIAASMRVFVMTTFFDGDIVSTARQAGAAGFFLKSGDWDEVVERLLDPASDWKAGTPTPLGVCEPIFEEEPSSSDEVAPICKAGAQVHEKNGAEVREVPPPLLGRLAAVFRPFFGRVRGVSLTPGFQPGESGSRMTGAVSTASRTP